jgi:hypothetical protein
MRKTLQYPLRRSTLIVVGSIVTLLAVTLPVTANSKPTTGAQISLFSPPTTFAANTPFYIEHGWFVCVGPDAMDTYCGGEPGYVGLAQGKGDFHLYVDGVLQPSTVNVETDVPLPGWVGISKFQLTNYPSGLPAGTYSFHGVWTLDGAPRGDETAVITFS